MFEIEEKKGKKKKPLKFMNYEVQIDGRMKTKNSIVIRKNILIFTKFMKKQQWQTRTLIKISEKSVVQLKFSQLFNYFKTVDRQEMETSIEVRRIRTKERGGEEGILDDQRPRLWRAIDERIEKN